MSKLITFFAGTLNSFALGSLEETAKLKKLVFDKENEGYVTIAFYLPKERKAELVYLIEKILNDKI